MLAALLALGVVMVGGLEARGATVQPSSTPMGLTNGPLAYQDTAGRVAITTIGSPEDGNANGTAPGFPQAGRAPAYSPSGLRIAFSRRVDGRRQIFVADADGTNGHQVTKDPAEAIDPTWSPSGLTLAFTSTRDGRPEIYTIRIDSSDERRLTDDPGDAMEADWSPKNNQIAFVSTRLGTYDVFVMNEDGSDPRPVAASPDRDLDPDWRNDGATLAFSSGTAAGACIYLIGSDGLGLRALSSSNAVDRFPSWSPTGDAIAFTRQDGGASSTWVTTVDDSALTSARLEIPGGRRADWGALAQPPVFAASLDQQATVVPTNGTVTVSPPKSDNTAKLADEGARVPLGYVVHAPGASAVKVSAAAPAASGSAATEATVRGTFELREPAADADAAITLRLRGPGPGDCSSSASSATTARAAAKKGKKGKKKKKGETKKKNFLHVKTNKGKKHGGKHHGVQTITGDSAASAKATEWITEQSCAGTLTTVLEGVVEVEDLTSHQTISLAAGQRYLAPHRP